MLWWFCRFRSSPIFDTVYSTRFLFFITFYFYFGHVQNIFAQLFYVAHIKSKCILSGTIMWNGSTCICVLVSAIKSINTSAEKFFDANANRVIGRQSHHYFDLTRFEFVDCIGYWNVIFTDFITLENLMVKLISLSAPMAYWWFYSDAFYVRISQIFRPNIQIFIFKIRKRRELSAIIEFYFK